jgi:hypothetical protein
VSEAWAVIRVFGVSGGFADIFTTEGTEEGRICAKRRREHSFAALWFCADDRPAGGLLANCVGDAVCRLSRGDSPNRDIACGFSENTDDAISRFVPDHCTDVCDFLLC